MDILAPIIVGVMLLAFGIGAGDETMAAAVGSGAVKMKYALATAVPLVIIGVIMFGEKVGKTLGKDLTGPSVQYDGFMMLAVITAVGIWLVIASEKGAPVSTTHSIVGAVIGAALLKAVRTGADPTGAVNYVILLEIAVGWIISPISGFVGAYALRSLMRPAEKRIIRGLKDAEKYERRFAIPLAAAVFAAEAARAGNDSANALGVLYGLAAAGYLGHGHVAILTSAAAGAMALGLVTVGRNVIKSVGGGLVEMRPSDGFAVQISATVVIILANLTGMPISGSQVTVFAVLGAAAVDGEKPRRKTLVKMITGWAVTLPVAAATSAAVYTLITSLIS